MDRRHFKYYRISRRDLWCAIVNLFTDSIHRGERQKIKEEMKTVKLTRAFQDDHVTLGMLQIQGIEHDPIYTLERPWIDNVQNVSCIPKDGYLVTKYDGYKFKDVFQVTGVPNRTAILFHKGNTVKDSTGCILLGLGAGSLHGQPAVLQSRDAMEYFKGLIGKKAFTLIIE